MPGLIKKYRIWLILLLLCAVQFIFSSCEELIDIDIEDIEQKIVIDGAITDASGASRVLLSLTENVFRGGGNIKLSNAKVIVEDGAGNSETLRESESGKYTFSSIRGEYGKTYTLKVEYKGKQYMGVSTLNSPMEIDSIRFVQKYTYVIWGYEYSSYFPKIHLKNRKGVDEYCLIKINDASNKFNRTTIVYRDKYAQDSPIVLEIDDSGYQKNETINIELLTIDKAAYEYFFQLNDLSEEDGIEIPDIFQMNTYNPKSNLSNGALGYFYAYSYKKYTAVVK